MKKFPGSIIDIEYHLPEKIIDNSYFQEKYPEWRVSEVEKRTGVYERRISAPNETAYDLALIATKKLTKKYPDLIGKIDAVIFCTQSPDYVLPSNAFLLQRDLGIKTEALIFDYNLACSGYLYGLLMASSFIKSGIVKNILLVTGDTYTKYLDEKDRATRMLFGDGASATWISAENQNDISPLIKSFDDFEFASDGRGWSNFIIKSGGNRQPSTCSDQVDFNDKIYMNGLQVLNLVNDRVIKQIHSLLKKNQVEVSQINQFLFHQASKLALDSLEKKLKIDNDRLFSNIEFIGNTVSSSIPILIKDYFLKVQSEKGNRLLLCGFGVGYSWCSLLATQ